MQHRRDTQTAAPQDGGVAAKTAKYNLVSILYLLLAFNEWPN